MKKQPILLLLLSVIILDSCSVFPRFQVEKRKHKKGFYLAHSNGETRLPTVKNDDKITGQDIKRVDSTITIWKEEITKEDITKREEVTIQSEPASGPIKDTITAGLYHKQDKKNENNAGLASAYPSSWEPYLKPKAKVDKNWNIVDQPKTLVKEGADDRLALMSLIMSAFGLFIGFSGCFLPQIGCVGAIIGLSFGLGGLITGIKALKMIKMKPDVYGGKTFATLGVVIGSIAVILWTTVLLLLFLVLALILSVI